jgi:hypothetical protein
MKSSFRASVSPSASIIRSRRFLPLRCKRSGPSRLYGRSMSRGTLSKRPYWRHLRPRFWQSELHSRASRVMTECSGRFFAAFDSSRSSLLPVYAPQATLSHNFTYTIPRRRVKSEVTVAPGKTSWDHWNCSRYRVQQPRSKGTLIADDQGIRAPRFADSN